MDKRIRHSCLLALIVCLLVLVVPLAVLAYWTLFLPNNDMPLQEVAQRLLEIAQAPDQMPHTPIIIVHGLWDGDSDQDSTCATEDGPFAYDTLLANHQYAPLHAIGPWLIEDGYAPYYSVPKSDVDTQTLRVSETLRV